MKSQSQTENTNQSSKDVVDAQQGVDSNLPSPRILDVDEQAKALDTIDFPKGTEGEYSSQHLMSGREKSSK